MLLDNTENFGNNSNVNELKIDFIDIFNGNLFFNIVVIRTIHH